MDTSRLCNAATLAKLLDLSERRIRQLASEGVIPKIKTGQYDIVGAIRGYTHYIHQRDEKDSSSYQEAKTRLINIQADLATLRLARNQDELIPATAVDNAWSDSILRARAILLGLPPRLSAQISQHDDLADDPHIVSRIIAQGINEALDELGKPITYEDNDREEDFDETADAADDKIDDDEDKHWR